MVHPAPGNPDGTLVNALLAHCGESLAGIGGVRRPGIVHRLDKDTSGLIVVAKTELAHRALSRDFAARRIARAYAAVVWGVPMPASGEIAGNIGRSVTNRKKMAVVGGIARQAGGDPLPGRARGLATSAALIECRLLDRPDPSDPRASGASRPSADRRSGLWRARRPGAFRRAIGARFPAPGPARPASRLHPSGDRRDACLRQRAARTTWRGC